MPALLGPDPSSVASPLSHAVVPQGVQVAQQKIPRSDRLEVSCSNFKKKTHFFYNLLFSEKIYFFSISLSL